ncbi:hypothetical protein AMTR_s00004p00023170 [Amborella trichopoda]|uniref:Uncharacterized protein n=2 Tax=Amborella trichopoda TaxID=13333 RepID=W1NDQ5_AMBTC|nr:hypothetical protein AMTR_s00004p00023170 [Amborella trichopoda]
MGDVLAQLETNLRCSKHKLTQEEEHVLRTCKAKAVRDFTFSACVASGVVWTVTRNLTYGFRINLSGGAAVLSGMWTFDNSLNSCLDHILALEGSRLQTELAKLIVTKHQDNPWRMRLMSKYFYPEKVFDDTNLDSPISRWRHRHYFGEPAAHKTSESTEKRDKQEVLPKLFTRSPAEDVIADPFDCILGYLGTSEDTSNETITISPRRRPRTRKHRHRLRHPASSAEYASP